MDEESPETVVALHSGSSVVLVVSEKRIGEYQRLHGGTISQGNLRELVMKKRKSSPVKFARKAEAAAPICLLIAFRSTLFTSAISLASSVSLAVGMAMQVRATAAARIA